MKAAEMTLVLLALAQAAHAQDWDAEAARLEMYRQHWNTHNIHRYEFLLDVSCFCYETSPVRVVVENGAVVAILDPVTREPVRAHKLEANQGEPPVDLDWYPAVDELFAEVERAIADRYGTSHPGQKASGFAVTYDEQYGFPATFTVDYSSMLEPNGIELRATDGQTIYRLSEFTSEPIPFRGAWVRTSEAPLSPRSRATIAWAGGEVFVFGGVEHYCPPMASCLPPPDPPLADGAAYDPTMDSWRKIADAPAGIVWAETQTVGEDIFLLAVTSFQERVLRLWRYQPTRDRWDEFELPEDMAEPGIAAFGSDLIVFARNDQTGSIMEMPDASFQRRILSDWRLDVASGEWTRLTESPLGPGFSRQYLAFGDDLYLFDHKLTRNPGGADGPSYLRAARLWRQQWETLPTADSIGSAPDLIAGTLLIAPALGCADGGGTNGYGRCLPFGAVFDTETDTWRELPNAPRRGYKHVQGSGGVSANGLSLGTPGHPALDATTGEWFTVPALDTAYTIERNVAAAGPYGFAFGGADTGRLLSEAWIWRP